MDERKFKIAARAYKLAQLLSIISFFGIMVFSRAILLFPTFFHPPLCVSRQFDLKELAFIIKNQQRRMIGIVAISIDAIVNESFDEPNGYLQLCTLGGAITRHRGARGVATHCGSST